jgi:hypothetical protein
MHLHYKLDGAAEPVIRVDLEEDSGRTDVARHSSSVSQIDWQRRENSLFRSLFPVIHYFTPVAGGRLGEREVDWMSAGSLLGREGMTMEWWGHVGGFSYAPSPTLPRVAEEGDVYFVRLCLWA